MISGLYFRSAFVFLLSFDFFSFSWTLTISFSWLYYTLVCSCPKKWLLLILQTSDKTSVDEWETSADEWRRVKMNEDKCRRVKTNQRQMRDEYRRLKTNERRVQTNERQVLFYHSWVQSLLLFILREEHVNLRSSLASSTLCYDF